MDMQITRLTNVSWLHFPDRQALAMRLVSQPSARFQARLNTSSTQALERLPMLDWPVNLFEDEKLDQ